jgi:hypothetical protein
MFKTKNKELLWSLYKGLHNTIATRELMNYFLNSKLNYVLNMSLMILSLKVSQENEENFLKNLRWVIQSKPDLTENIT